MHHLNVFGDRVITDDAEKQELAMEPG